MDMQVLEKRVWHEAFMVLMRTDKSLLEAYGLLVADSLVAVTCMVVSILIEDEILTFLRYSIFYTTRCD